MDGRIFGPVEISLVSLMFPFEGRTNIKLPALNVLSGIFACDHYNELRDLAANHPFVKLGHYFLDVGFDLVVG